jgi:threonine synthase
MLKRKRYFAKFINKEITIACTLTGHGLKDPQLAIKSIKNPPVVRASTKDVIKAAGI